MGRVESPTSIASICMYNWRPFGHFSQFQGYITKRDQECVVDDVVRMDLGRKTSRGELGGRSSQNMDWTLWDLLGADVGLL